MMVARDRKRRRKMRKLPLLLLVLSLALIASVSASQLSIAQAAMLAAIPKAPSHYSPRRYPEAALQRRNLVLNNMFQQEYVSAKQLQQALDEDLDLAAPQAASETEVPYWVALVREQLVAKYGSNTVLQ